jgi:hypothetical protein
MTENIENINAKDLLAADLITEAVNMGLVTDEQLRNIHQKMVNGELTPDDVVNIFVEEFQIATGIKDTK